MLTTEHENATSSSRPRSMAGTVDQPSWRIAHILETIATPATTGFDGFNSSAMPPDHRPRINLLPLTLLAPTPDGAE
jgi:hypothetical protein